MPTRTKTASAKTTRRRRKRDDEEDAEDTMMDSDAAPKRDDSDEDEDDDDDYRRNNTSIDNNNISTHDDRETSNMIHEHHQQETTNLYVEDPDEDTLRVMLSTDNHLGYAENDTVRGNDSFAALEEVLYLAKFYRCDMVLLAGDLFHENRPTRRTLYKASEYEKEYTSVISFLQWRAEQCLTISIVFNFPVDIFRRYCMGPDAVQVQILGSKTSTGSGGQATTKKSAFSRGIANYEDAFYSVDLPVLSIHGNHDDPSRDGGNSDLYAALDLLDVANLVNYFGKQQDTQDIQVDPVLLKKGETNVALYGLSNMRDERLNRMWRSEKLSFTQPAKKSEDEEKQWFNLLALHQNRDVGRGKKNCIKEDMIPDWFDFICWGHEHESRIEVQESVVGTFRISQPGSSVATSLVEGESERKRVGLLDIKGTNFRLTPIPLTQVRSFVLGSLCLADEPRLDPDDPKADIKMSNIMEEKVNVLILEAKEKHQELLQAAHAEGNILAKFYMDRDKHGPPPVKNVITKEDEVLVRLKVDHHGFPAMNNQRFGAKFVGEVANPTDILLFHRKRAEAGSRKSSVKDVKPIEPTDIEQMNIEDLIVEELDLSDKKLQVLKEKKISKALDKYVDKGQAQAINEAVKAMIEESQKDMMKGKSKSPSDSFDGSEDEELEKENTGSKSKSRGKKRSNRDSDDEEEEEPPARSTKKKSAATGKRKAAPSRRKARDEDDDSFDDDDEVVEVSKPKSRAASARGGRARKKNASYAEDSDDDVEEVEPPPKKKRATKKREPVVYDLESDDDVIELVDDSPPPKKKPARGKAAASSKATKGKRGKKSAKYDDSDDDDDFAASARSKYDGDDDDWGASKSNSTFS
ncbi:MAG: hypothetical protein SGILL_006055 [Bacillariaceae sp.]